MDGLTPATDGTFDLYSSSEYSSSFYFSGFGSGTHTIQVRATGTKDSVATDDRASLDWKERKFVNPYFVDLKQFGLVP